jgi:hypothetical protein
MRRYIELDGYKYAVAQDSYTRSWLRQHSMQISAATITTQFVDRGPGLRAYKATIMVAQWASDSELYKDGITQTVAEQVAHIEAAYEKIATPLVYVDPLGVQPQKGVFFINLTQIIPAYSTVQKSYVQYQIELYEVGKETQ